jgi:hypothetical protein
VGSSTTTIAPQAIQLFICTEPIAVSRGNSLNPGERLVRIICTFHQSLIVSAQYLGRVLHFLDMASREDTLNAISRFPETPQLNRDSQCLLSLQSSGDSHSSPEIDQMRFLHPTGCGRRACSWRTFGLHAGGDGPARPLRGRCGWSWAFSPMCDRARLLCLALCFWGGVNYRPHPHRSVRVPVGPAGAEKPCR